MEILKIFHCGGSDKINKGLRYCILQIQIFYSLCLQNFFTMQWSFWDYGNLVIQDSASVFENNCKWQCLIWLESFSTYCLYSHPCFSEIYSGVNRILSNKQRRNKNNRFHFMQSWTANERLSWDISWGQDCRNKNKNSSIIYQMVLACRHCRQRKDLKIYRGKARVAGLTCELDKTLIECGCFSPWIF